MIYAFDLDGTLCHTDGNDYNNSKPIYNRIKVVNELYDKGEKVIIYTARGSVSGLTKELMSLTKDSLANWDVKYHELSMGNKIHFDILIDDKAITANDWFSKQDKPIVGFIASSFDLIHPGYVKLLKDCKSVCTHLVCAIHENPNIERENKSIPVHSLLERKEILSSIKYVDEVTCYQTEEELVNLLKHIKPDVRILGTDYKDKKYTGIELGIPIHWHERNHDYSATNLRKKIANDFHG